MTRRSRGGFTLIETMVALVLATITAVAMMGVLTSLKHMRTVAERIPSPEPWKMRLERRVQDDLRMARRMRLTTNELRLLGYGSHGKNDGPTQRPAEIVYAHIRDAQGRLWLTRRERLLDESNSPETIILCGPDLQRPYVTAYEAWDRTPWTGKLSVQREFAPLPRELRGAILDSSHRLLSHFKLIHH